MEKWGSGGEKPSTFKLFFVFVQHLLAFLFAELGTSGAIDGNNQLIMKGRFQQKHIENVLRRYEYSIQLPTLPFLSMVEVVV